VGIGYRRCLAGGDTMNLNDRMQFGNVVHVHADGTVTDSDTTEYVPEVVYQELDDEGQCIDDIVHDVPQGWSLMIGYSGQYSYSGPVMHSSEYIGGGLERAILDNPGLYVAVIVDGLSADESDDAETESIGWAVAFKETDESKWSY
jgi:hypothetical protein